MKGIPRKVSVGQISALQMKKYVRKGCKVFVVHVMNDEFINKEDKLKFDDSNLKIIHRCFPRRDPRITSKTRIGFYY